MKTHNIQNGRAAGLLVGVAFATGVASSAQAGTPPDFDAEAYCAASLALEDAPEPDIEWDEADEDELVAAGKVYAVDVLGPLADDIVAAAPPELAEAAATFDAGVDELAETGDFAVFETPEMTAVFEEAHAFDLATCGWNVVEVNAVDYHYENLPTELPSGPTSFELGNTGEEPHELAVFRKNDGVTMSVEELLEVPEEEVFDLVTFVDQAFADPGGHGYTVQNLTPGDYVALCFVPTGGEDGPPHITHGMYAEFTVVA
ncbi:MAG: hypothetical protein ACRD0G_01935 [Acidimicrobiales bacterium]